MFSSLQSFSPDQLNHYFYYIIIAYNYTLIDSQTLKLKVGIIICKKHESMLPFDSSIFKPNYVLLSTFFIIAIPGGKNSREGRINPVQIKVLPRGKSLDACAKALQAKSVKVLKSAATKRMPKANHFDSLNKLIGDKKPDKIEFKFKPGHSGLVQADEKLAELNGKLCNFVRLYNDNLGQKAHLAEEIAKVKKSITVCTNERRKIQAKLDRAKAEKEWNPFNGSFNKRRIHIW